MNKKETRTRIQILEEAQAIEDSTPLKIHLKPHEFEGVSYNSYIRKLKDKRAEERSGVNLNNSSSKPKP